MKFGIGQSVPRTEDVRLLTGEGRYVDDIAASHALHAVFMRSPVAHAKITELDTEDARAAPGVRAVLTAAELAADGIKGLGCTTLFPGVQQNVAAPPAPLLMGDRALYVGAAIAMVVAETRAQALDAAEMIVVDYEDLPAAVTIAEATADAAPQINEAAPNNIAFDISLGDKDATEAALAGAAHVTTLSLHNNRLSANALEPRAAHAEWDRREGRLIFHASTQAPHGVRAAIAGCLGLPQTAVRVIADDVGGGFGMKGTNYPEEALVAWAAKRLRAAVRWRADRGESLAADFHGRDQDVEAELGFDAEGRIVALRVRMDYSSGPFLAGGGGVSPLFASTLATGNYRVPVAHTYARAVYTNTSPTQPYRGAGRPEASYLIERLMDKAAREMGRDRIELRRLNLLTAAEMPYQTPLVYNIDSGDYAAVLDRALEAADWAGADARKDAAKAKGKLRGIGIAVHMENAGLVNDMAEIRLDQAGGVSVLVGTFSHGQGHETVYAQMVSEFLGVPFGGIRIIQGDTDAVKFGRGTVASRSMINGGGAIRVAADRVIDKGKAIAAHLMEVAPDDITFEDGTFSVAGTDKAMPIQQIAAMSYLPILPPELGLGLSAEGDFKLEGFAFPNGCQIAEVEVDPETGVTEVLRIVSIDDVGTVINPMLLEGQMVGGIAMGLGQALMEDLIYDESGQLVTGSFMDYAMPRADDMPPIVFETKGTPTKTNPLGAKGAGEAGTVGATPVIISAILDALAPLGVENIALPATPLRVWEAIRAAGR